MRRASGSRDRDDVIASGEQPGEGIHRAQRVGVRRAQDAPLEKYTFPRPANFIDEHVFAKLKVLRLPPSELCSDSEFLRRACLDITGTLPTLSREQATALVEAHGGRIATGVSKKTSFVVVGDEAGSGECGMIIVGTQTGAGGQSFRAQSGLETGYAARPLHARTDPDCAAPKAAPRSAVGRLKVPFGAIDPVPSSRNPRTARRFCLAVTHV